MEANASLNIRARTPAHSHEGVAPASMAKTKQETAPLASVPTGLAVATAPLETVDELGEDAAAAPEAAELLDIEVMAADEVDVEAGVDIELVLAALDDDPEILGVVTTTVEPLGFGVVVVGLGVRLVGGGPIRLIVCVVGIEDDVEPPAVARKELLEDGLMVSMVMMPLW